MKEAIFKMLSVYQSNKFLAYYLKMVHLISSLSCCVKYCVSKSVSQLCTTLYILSYGNSKAT